ncbi:hypothetical protein QBC34DRAFT_415521 [Podospora aff. communis PSN243]|uniref:Tubulin-specific chaperone A n=1 Tax=Podospora aff. communis PSN243 TaxID=3040156 RepID=A0AAV9GA53_9PEZI|nr:hypothetical protein QBC34DRAFT_415521 [Podospora aff. communis PSN243]
MYLGTLSHPPGLPHSSNTQRSRTKKKLAKSPVSPNFTSGKDGTLRRGEIWQNESTLASAGIQCEGRKLPRQPHIKVNNTTGCCEDTGRQNTTGSGNHFSSQRRHPNSHFINQTSPHKSSHISPHFPPSKPQPRSTATMAPPSALAIATQAVQRLVKEESYYHKEQASQENRIKKLEEDIAAGGANLDSNAEYVLKQEVRNFSRPFRTAPVQVSVSQKRIVFLTSSVSEQKTALEETKKVFEPLKERIVKAVGTLEEQIAISESDGVAPAEELTKAKEALKSGQKVGGLTDE